MEDRRKRTHKQFHIRFGKNEWRPEFNHVVMWSVCPCQNTQVSQPLHNVGSLFRSRGSRLRGLNEINSEEEPRAANISQNRIVFLQHLEIGNPLPANHQRVLLQFLLFENIKDSQARRAGDGISAKSTEELHSVVE